MECEKKCEDRMVKLGYVADCDHCIKLVNALESQVFDLLPVIQGGETDTSIALLDADPARIRYYPEKYTRTSGREGCFYDICISDIAAHIKLNDLEDVDAPEPFTGSSIIYNAVNGTYETFDLAGATSGLQDQIDALNERCATIEASITTINATLAEHNRRINRVNELLSQLTTTVEGLADRLGDIEGAIYNWSTDKSTKIPRGNINITSGGYSGDNGIFSRTKNQNNDLNFE